MGGAVVEIARYIALYCFSLALLAVVLTACGTASSNDSAGAGPEQIIVQAGISPPGFADQLPPPSALLPLLGSEKRASYSEDDYIRHGNQINSGLPLRNAVPITNYVQFDTDWSAATGMDPADLGFCCFSFDNLSAFTRDPEVRYGWSFPPEDIGTAWLALADWDLNAWVWHQCTAESVFTVASFDPYTSPTDQLVALVLMANAEKSSLRWIRLGPKLVTADLTASPAQGMAPLEVALDASGSSPGVGTTITYAFDFDEDGEYDMGSSSPTYDYLETAPGQHTYSVQALNGYGVAATASAQVIAHGPWTHSWGGSGTESISAITTDGQNSIYVVGTTKSYGAGAEDVLVLKYNLNGTLAWAHCWGGTEEDIAHAAVYADDGLYVAGETYSFGVGSFDALLQRWDADGNVVWTTTYGISSEDDPGMTRIHGVTASGDKLYLAGSHNYIGADYGVLVLQCDPDGTVNWGNIWMDSTYNVAYAIAAYYNNISQSTTLHITGVRTQDLLYLRYDDDGTLLSSRTWNGDFWQIGTAISVYGLFQDVFISGWIRMNQYSDVLLLTPDADTAKRWGGSGSDSVSGMLRQDDSLYLCGSSDSFHPSRAGLLLKCTADSALEDIQLFKSDSIDEGFSSICRFPGSGYLMGGACASADGGSWAPASDSFSDQPGTWTDVSALEGVFNGETTSPTVAALDITDGVINMGGGEADALVAARAFD